ncbi:hypothetical protein BDW02DRAFT_373769 [Decorospora gaudefroyi]|uniref:DUF7820 domain-containing protein n=1 Tax=Decorospora gaudefroyi TaxID=184978 RepID=A0A6A5KBE0_9PLEO|nr:hypothetical protein BDW02DRAFT_373769 [Decorospora gaudefroyi]
MRLPNRSIGSIQPLPSIFTAFPPNHDSNQSTDTSGINSGTCFIRRIEDGIEVVPFERSNALSAPILSPDQGEKEVFVTVQEETNVGEKPLPTPPRCIWHRMSPRQRIFAVLALQFLMLMTIGLSLLAAKGRSPQSDQESTARVASDSSPRADTTNSIHRGIFALPVQLPQQQSSACLATVNESVAWQCAYNTTFQLSVLPAPAEDDNTTMITIGSLSSNDTIHHGDQVPNIPAIKLLAVRNPASDDGFAYHFRTTYNRVVLLKEDDFIMTKKRQAQPPTTHPEFSVGESLWRCTFNETLLEGHIYINKPTRSDDTDIEADMVNATATVRLPKVPYTVKLVEERMPNGKTPYCEKMLVGRDGTLVSDSERMMLNLSDPEAEVSAALLKRKRTKRMELKDRQQGQDSKNCRCQWLMQ